MNKFEYYIDEQKYGDARYFFHADHLHQAAEELYEESDKTLSKEEFIQEFIGAARLIVTEDLDVDVEIDGEPYRVSVQVAYYADQYSFLNWEDMYEWLEAEWYGPNTVYRFNFL